MSKLKTTVVTVAIAAAASLAVMATTAIADGTVTYKGQGFNYDGTTYNLNDERCGLEGQGTANDGGTGQFADWNGDGQPYEQGQGYLVWVLTANGATGATLNLPDGTTVEMIKVGGTFKYASQYYHAEDLVGVTANYTGTARGQVQLTVSHGCQPFETEGAWCSPGYWGRAQDAAWALIGVDRATATFGGTVASDAQFTATDPTRVNAISSDLLQTVMTATGQQAATKYKGASVGTFKGWAANPFNLTGAWLTDQIPGYTFDPDLADPDNPDNEVACPIDNHGTYKEDLPDEVPEA
jgi:hypothetical protein